MSSTFHIFNFLFRTTACPATKLTTIVPLGVRKKCYIFVNVFSKAISFEVTRLVINVPLGVHSSEVLLVFGLIRNPRLPLLIGQSIFILLFQKNCLLCQQTFKKCFFRGSNVFLQFLQPHFSYIVTYKFVYLYIII